jgi:hypothetical protein
MCSDAQLGHISSQLQEVLHRIDQVGERVEDHSGRIRRVESGLQSHASESADDRDRMRRTLYGANTGTLGEDRGVVGLLDQLIRGQRNLLGWVKYVIAPVTVAVLAGALLAWLFGTSETGVVGMIGALS